MAGGAVPSRRFSAVCNQACGHETLPRQVLTAVPASAQTLIYIDAVERGEKKRDWHGQRGALVKGAAHNENG